MWLKIISKNQKIWIYKFLECERKKSICLLKQEIVWTIYYNILSTLKIFTTYRLRVIFHLVGIFRTSSLGESTSSNPEKIAPRRWGKEPGYIEVLQQRASSLNIKRLLLKKTRCSKLSNLVLFYVCCSVVSNSLQPRGLQHTRLSCPSPSPRVCSNSSPIESVMPSSHLILCCCLLLLPSTFPSIRVLPMSQKRWLLAAGCQSIGSSASASVLPMNIQGWLLSVGRGKSLGSLKSFLSRASQQGGASFLYFTHSEVPWGCSLMTGNLRYSSPSWVPLGLRSSHLRAATADACDLLVYW